MMTVDDYINRNIETILKDARRNKPFGTSYIQRVCGIGYNQARHTIDKCLQDGILVKDGDCEFRYRFAS